MQFGFGKGAVHLCKGHIARSVMSRIRPAISWRCPPAGGFIKMLVGPAFHLFRIIPGALEGLRMATIRVEPGSQLGLCLSSIIPGDTQTAKIIIHRIAAGGPTTRQEADKLATCIEQSPARRAALCSSLLPTGHLPVALSGKILESCGNRGACRTGHRFHISFGMMNGAHRR